MIFRSHGLSRIVMMSGIRRVLPLFTARWVRVAAGGVSIRRPARHAFPLWNGSRTTLAVAMVSATARGPANGRAEHPASSEGRACTCGLWVAGVLLSHQSHLNFLEKFIPKVLGGASTAYMLKLFSSSSFSYTVFPIFLIQRLVCQESALFE
jgi:hypothetical protein